MSWLMLAQRAPNSFDSSACIALCHSWSWNEEVNMEVGGLGEQKMWSILRKCPRRKASRKIDGSDELSWRASTNVMKGITPTCWQHKWWKRLCKKQHKWCKKLRMKRRSLLFTGLCKECTEMRMNLIPMSWQSTMQESKLLLLQLLMSSYLLLLHQDFSPFHRLLSHQRIFWGLLIYQHPILDEHYTRNRCSFMVSWDVQSSIPSPDITAVTP